jgi:glycosyltransferase involved in cell wall biosynthesis
MLPAGSLDGVTAFRFAHMFRSPQSGGVESYLYSLNRKLLERNHMQILQMYLTDGKDGLSVQTEHIGHGTIIWIPSLLTINPSQDSAKTRSFWKKLKMKLARNCMVCHDNLLSTLSDFPIDLAVFHWISEDSSIVMDYLGKRAVPFVVFNHFENSRLKWRLIRKQISRARAVGGVADIGVPRFVRSGYVNLSDGIDTDFFDPEKAHPLRKRHHGPIILLPSRITGGKGHMDAIRVVGRLRRQGITPILVLAGRLENASLLNELRLAMAKERIQENVVIAGELSPEELRDWYAASDLVILPSRAEGLGRVLLESQAMGTPVVAYAVGGTPSAISDGVTGILVPRLDPKRFADAVAMLLRDHEKRLAMGRDGRRWIVKDFSLEALAARHELFYYGALAAGAEKTV